MISGRELTQLAMHQLGYSEPAELSRHLGMTAYSSPRRVKRWLDGETNPNYEQALRLLEIVGMLREPEGVEVHARAAQSAVPDDLKAAVAALSATTDRLLKDMERIAAGGRIQDPPRPAEAARSRATRRRAG